METLLCIIVLIFALSFLFERLSNFLKQLNDPKARSFLAKGNAIHIDCTVDCINKKDKVHTKSMDHTHDNLD